MPRRKETRVIKAISLGWGVQSVTLVAMVALGYLEPVDVILHADTQHEREQTYEYAKRMTPYFTAKGLNIVTLVTDRKYGTSPAVPELKQTQLPAFTTSPKGGEARVNRQCTDKWKIAPVRKYLKNMRGNSQPVELWIGISADEKQRAKPSGLEYITHRFPLIELGMTRNDCIQWLKYHDIEVPGKSSCVFCPFLNKDAWKEMKRENGKDWAHAIEVDEMIRDVRPPGKFYVHRSRKPLAEAIILDDEPIANDEGTDKLYLDAECESGHCFI